MRKAIGIVLLLLAMCAVGSAWAAEIQGKIKSLDMASRVLGLEDGTQIWVAEGLSMDTLREGASVRATYEERDGRKLATSIEVE